MRWITNIRENSHVSYIYFGYHYDFLGEFHWIPPSLHPVKDAYWNVECKSWCKIRENNMIDDDSWYYKKWRWKTDIMNYELYDGSQPSAGIHTDTYWLKCGQKWLYILNIHSLALLIHKLFLAIKHSHFSLGT